MASGTIEYQVLVHDEDGSLWAEIPELPGLFVSGDSDDELAEALAEAIPMYLTDAGQKPFSVDVREFGQVHRILVDC
jgi:predicted RNase H-like HicB family nuclease